MAAIADSGGVLGDLLTKMQRLETMDQEAGITFGGERDDSWKKELQGASGLSLVSMGTPLHHNLEISSPRNGPPSPAHCI